MKRTKNIWCFVLLLCLSVSFVGCEDEQDGGTMIKNDCLKRTLGPNVVGETIEFVYAIALPYGSGKIVSAEVEASIQGAATTKLENKSYYTNASGADVPVLVGNPCINDGNVTRVEFTVDTCAASLRYYYVIPEVARGQKLTFNFTAMTDNGETVSFKMGPYDISNMDIKRGLELNNDCYISIEDLAVYDAATAATVANKIDLVYLWRNIYGVNFGHSFVAPAAESDLLPGVILPSGVDNETKVRKEWGAIDTHLIMSQTENVGTYIDDIDFKEIDLTNMPDYSLNMKVKGGMWIETGDGKYRAFIYINKLNATSGGTISIKRYKMK
ncbi:MAG: DUF4466 family protein [Bacteroidales bacterium]|nr:DUF4466 family protein [Bacteroidales bacterium]